MLQITIVILVLMSVPVLVMAIRRWLHERSMLSLSFCLLTAFLTATFLSAFFHVDNFTELVNMGQGMANRAITIPMISGGLLFCGTIINAVSFLLVRYVNKKNAWKSFIGLMVAFLICNLGVGIVGSMVTGISVDMCFFATCCASKVATNLILLRNLTLSIF